MNQELFNDWLENEVTQYFLKYLKDSAKKEAELVADTILSGGIPSDIERFQTPAVCMTLNEISEINFEEIDVFYTEEKEDGSVRSESSH